MNEWEIPAGRVATRAAVRFPLRLPIRMETENGTIDAVTRDVSANGLLFETKEPPAVGTPIEFTLRMPAQVMGWENDVAIHCFGRVVRHQQDGDERLAGAVIDEYFLKA